MGCPGADAAEAEAVEAERRIGSPLLGLLVLGGLGYLVYRQARKGKEGA